jgi:hypothetical protein
MSPGGQLNAVVSVYIGAQDGMNHDTQEDE